MPDFQTIDSAPLDIDTSIPGVRVYRRGSSGADSIVVRSVKRRPRWTVFHKWELDGETKTPGTTIVYEDKSYCVETEEQIDGMWEYRLQVWPSIALSLGVERLDAKTIPQEDADAVEQVRIDKGLAVSMYHEAFIGCLPRRILEILEMRWHFSSEDASRKNALVEFFLFLPLTALCVAFLQFYAGMLLSLFTLEGLVRYGHVLASNRACGLTILEVADALFLRLRAWRERRMDKREPH